MGLGGRNAASAAAHLTSNEVWHTHPPFVPNLSSFCPSPPPLRLHASDPSDLDETCPSPPPLRLHASGPSDLDETVRSQLEVLLAEKARLTEEKNRLGEGGYLPALRGYT